MVPTVYHFLLTSVNWGVRGSFDVTIERRGSSFLPANRCWGMDCKVLFLLILQVSSHWPLRTGRHFVHPTIIFLSEPLSMQWPFSLATLDSTSFWPIMGYTMCTNYDNKVWLLLVSSVDTIDTFSTDLEWNNILLGCKSLTHMSPLNLQSLVLAMKFGGHCRSTTPLKLCLLHKMCSIYTSSSVTPKC